MSRFPSLLLTSLLVLAPARVLAQDSSRVATDTGGVPLPPVPPPPGAPRDSITYPRGPVGPMGALWRSMLIPGWGQAKLNRKLTGALFVAWEGVTLGMSIKVSHELSYLEATGSQRVGKKRQERQDWLVLLGFNHLFAAIEAYVSSHLWDFPPDLTLQAAPGRVGAIISVPVRFR
jgi:hypothetical protein